MIVLDGYAAKRCPVRVHNDFSPLVPTLRWEPSPEEQRELDAGLVFEAVVFSELLRLHPETAVFVQPGLKKEVAIAMTVEAMKSGTPLVLAGWLPDDVAGGRTGRPDILIKVDGGYLPADIKNHKTLKAAKRSVKLVSSIAEPALLREVPAWTATAHHYMDGLQLAHYTRLLQAAGFHPGGEATFGAIVGTSVIATPGSDAGLVFVWHDLTKPSRPTFSRTKGKATRSVLERYDHEHAFRVTVATRAAEMAGSSDDSSPLVAPIGQLECNSCPYREVCLEKAGPDDASFAVTRDRLDIREWRALRDMGIRTTEELANLDPWDQHFFDRYYVEVTHRSADQARLRLEAATRQARMIRDGVAFETLNDAEVEVPKADVEVDLDIEWDNSGRIYQWGIRVREGQDENTARYEPIVSFDTLDDWSELQLAEVMARRLIQLRSDAEQAGRSFAIYHWHHVEVTKTRQFPCVTAALEGVTNDLFAWFTGNFRVRGEASLKEVAKLFGFVWAVDDPSGRTSQAKIEVARGGGIDSEEAKNWCLSYNQSDVAAQAAIRDGLRMWCARNG